MTMKITTVNAEGQRPSRAVMHKGCPKSAQRTKGAQTMYKTILTTTQFMEEVAKLPTEDVAQDYTSSSIYLRVTPQTSDLVRNYRYRSGVSTFVDEIEHKVWYEIPFMKLPCHYIEELNK